MNTPNDIDPTLPGNPDIFDPDERVQVRCGMTRITYVNGTCLGTAWWEEKSVQVELDNGKVVWVDPHRVRRLTLLERIADAAR